MELGALRTLMGRDKMVVTGTGVELDALPWHSDCLSTSMHELDLVWLSWQRLTAASNKVSRQEKGAQPVVV